MQQLPEAVVFNFGIPEVIIMSWFAIFLMFLISIIVVIKLKKTPSGLQNLFEAYFDFIINLIDSVMGKDGKNYYPLFIGLFLYIFISNLLGLIPGLISPTSNLNTVVALALIVFFSTHLVGIHKYGLLKYFKHFTGDVPVFLKPFMFIIEIISQLARPLSLSFRLFGNMVAKEILLAVLCSLIIIFFPSSNIMQKILTIAPVVLLPFIYLLGALVVFIQAFVFTILSIFYINGAIQIHEEKDKHE